MQVVFDDTTKKKAGRHLDGLARYRNGAGAARPEYRTLRGVNFVVGIRRIPLHHWPGHHRSVPVGLELYLKETQAHALNLPYRSRSQLARDILAFITEQWPTVGDAGGGAITVEQCSVGPGSQGSAGAGAGLYSMLARTAGSELPNVAQLR